MGKLLLSTLPFIAQSGSSALFGARKRSGAGAPRYKSGICILLLLLSAAPLDAQHREIIKAPKSQSSNAPVAAPSTRASIITGASAATMSPSLAPSAAPSVQPAPRSIVLSTGIDLPFAADQTFFFISLWKDKEEIVPFWRVRGSAVPAVGQTGESSYKIWVGARIGVPPGVTKARYHLLITGKSGEFFSLPEQELSVNEGELSADTLRKVLTERREVQRRVEERFQTQEQSLERLRQDASVIGNFGKILELRDEYERTKRDVARLERDTTSLERALVAAREMQPPNNYARWEGQLTEQLTESAQAAKRAESEEQKRGAKVSAVAMRKSAQLEEARSEDIDALVKELAMLKKEREELEVAKKRAKSRNG